MSAAKRSPLVLVVLHGLWVVLITVSILSGFRISADSQSSWLNALSGWLPQGAVWLWHVASAIVLCALVIAYLVFYMQRKRLSAHRRNTSAITPHRTAYLLLLALVPLSITTGIMNAVDADMLIPESLHRYCAYGYLIFVIIHLFGHALQGGVQQCLRIFRPVRRMRWVLHTLMAGIVSLIAASLWLLNNAQLLEAEWITAPININGKADEVAWQQASEVSVYTQHGANLIEGSTTIRVKALYDKDHLYLSLRWQDPTRSQKHLPLQKTEQGWRIMQTDFLLAGEDTYYEDKLAILLANSDSLANLKSIHLGKQPLSDQPEALNGRGLHYTLNGKIYDLWHWQSVRSNVHQQADDSYFGPPKDAPKGFPRQISERQTGTFRRYTAGYQKDPPTTWNGTSMNWESFDNDRIKPRRLPKELDDIALLQQESLNPKQSDQADWWMAWDDTRPYLEELDTLPAGSILPGVLIKPRRQGDRGDIQAAGRWHDGYWYLEMKRRLDTQSSYDVALNNNTYLWFAVFDHTQTRHTRHLRPLRLQLKGRK